MGAPATARGGYRLYQLICKNIFNLPLLSFVGGFGLTLLTRIKALTTLRLPARFSRCLSLYLLACIGIKGGRFLVEPGSMSLSMVGLLLCLVGWGVLQPWISFHVIRRFTRLDKPTAAAVAAAFGSVSVMTFITATAFLERLHVEYHNIMLIALAIMETPAIIAGLILGKQGSSEMPSPTAKVVQHALINQVTLTMIGGLVVGALLDVTGLFSIGEVFLGFFTPALCLFLLDMGLHVGHHRHHFRAFSWPLNAFAIYMPLIGGGVGLFLGWLFSLNLGTTTLVATLLASASYIAVPAAMRLALPQAKEGVYLPLALGIAFPFNVIIGIPLYHYLARLLLA